MRISTTLLLLTAVLALTACGRTPSSSAELTANQAAQSQPSAMDASESPSTPSASAPASPSAPLQAADVEAYARGMQSEVEWLRKVGEEMQQARAAKDDNAVLQALSHANSPDLDAAAAKAAGLDVPRYGHVRNAIDGVLMSVAVQSAPGAPAALEIDPYREMSGDVAAALKAKMSELQELHAQALGLRMKLADG